MTPLPCPGCGSKSSLRVLYGAHTARMKRSVDAGKAVFAENPAWRSGPDRQCQACGRRFFWDLHAKDAYDRESEIQISRMKALREGRYMFFNPRTQSADEIARAFNDEIRAKGAPDSGESDPGEDI